MVLSGVEVVLLVAGSVVTTVLTLLLTTQWAKPKRWLATGVLVPFDSTEVMRGLPTTPACCASATLVIEVSALAKADTSKAMLTDWPVPSEAGNPTATSMLALPWSWVR